MSSAVVNFSTRRPAGASRAAAGAEPSASPDSARPRRSKAILATAVVVLGALLGIAHLATVLAVAPVTQAHGYFALAILALLAPIAVAVGVLVLRRGFGTLLGQLRRRADSECEQIMIRLAIALVLCGYVTVSQLLAGYTSEAMQVSLLVLGAFEAASLVLLLWLVLRPVGALNAPVQVLGYAATMAVVSTVVPVFLTAEALRRVGANTVAIVGALGPVSTIALGWIGLEEAMTPLQLGGVGLVLIGVLAVSVRPRD